MRIDNSLMLRFENIKKKSFKKNPARIHGDGIKQFYGDKTNPLDIIFFGWILSHVSKLISYNCNWDCNWQNQFELIWFELSCWIQNTFCQNFLENSYDFLWSHLTGNRNNRKMWVKFWIPWVVLIRFFT